MRISDILSQDMVIADIQAPSKDEVIKVLAERMAEHPGVDAIDGNIFTALMNRERLGSTGVGEGVAIPHAKIPGLSELVACFARVSEGVPFDAIDKKPATLIFVLLVPEHSAGAHLKALARISRLLKDAEFRGVLMQFTDSASIYDAFVQEDSKFST